MYSQVAKWRGQQDHREIPRKKTPTVQCVYCPDVTIHIDELRCTNIHTYAFRIHITECFILMFILSVLTNIRYILFAQHQIFDGLFFCSFLRNIFFFIQFCIYIFWSIIYFDILLSFTYYYDIPIFFRCHKVFLIGFILYKYLILCTCLLHYLHQWCCIRIYELLLVQHCYLCYANDS